MTFKIGNKAVRDHALTGRALYLFEALGKGKKQKYLGEFSLANYSIRRGPDKHGNERDIIVFHLISVFAAQTTIAESDLPSADVSLTLAEARKRALAACVSSAGAAGKTAVRSLYDRSRDVRDYVLMRAAGECEGCLQDAPFQDKLGKPYLEAHHTTRLSDGGLDHPRHVAALCPNCHREVHFGKKRLDLNKQVIVNISTKEDQNR